MSHLISLHIRSMWETICDAVASCSVWKFGSTRMYSSRMRTTCSSSHHRGAPSPARAGTPLEQAPPPGQIPLNFSLGWGPGPDPPQLLPWVWPWSPPPARSPWTSPLGVGLETCKACWYTTPLETCCKACWDTTYPPQQNSWHTLLKILPCPKLHLWVVKIPVYPNLGFGPEYPRSWHFEFWLPQNPPPNWNLGRSWHFEFWLCQNIQNTPSPPKKLKFRHILALWIPQNNSPPP